MRPKSSRLGANLNVSSPWEGRFPMRPRMHIIATTRVRLAPPMDAAYGGGRNIRHTGAECPEQSSSRTRATGASPGNVTYVWSVTGAAVDIDTSDLKTSDCATKGSSLNRCIHCGCSCRSFADAGAMGITAQLEHERCRQTNRRSPDHKACAVIVLLCTNHLLRRETVVWHEICNIGFSIGIGSWLLPARSRW